MKENPGGRRQNATLVGVGLLAVVVLAIAVSKQYFFSSGVSAPPPSIISTTTQGPSATHPPLGTSVQMPSSVIPNTPSQNAHLSYNVVTFGADPTGKRDSTLAIRAAILAAQKKPGSEVYFPNGRYILNRPSQKLFDFVIREPIRVVGAGAANTTIINEVGQKTPGVHLSTDMFAVEVAPGTQTGGGSGTVITGLTLDSATYDAGTDIMDFANHTTISNLRVLAARSTNTYNYNSFGIRVIAICNPGDVSRIYRVDNVVENVTIIGQGTEGTTELDLSCQVNAVANNITIFGNGLDIFYCHNDLVENANLTGGSSGSTNYYTWVITGSYNITLADVATNGIGGVIAPDIQIVSHGITVTNEEMKNKNALLYIGDSRDVSIMNSALGGIALEPKFGLSGFTVKNTSFNRVLCKANVSKVDMSGLSCGA